MYYIKLDDGMNLVTTVWEPIYRGDHLNQKITYLIPRQVGDIDMLTAVVYLNFIRADGEPDVVMLDRQDELYKDVYFQYTLPVTCKLSRYAGEVVTWMQIYSGPASAPTIAKSGENVLQVMESKDMDCYIGDWRGDKMLTALYQMKRQADDEFERVDETFAQVNEDIEMLIATKADNIVFDSESSTIQLTADGEPIGDKIYVNTSIGKMITDMRLSTDGELLVFFDDGSILNVGKVVSESGKVYVPHIDAHKILTFTIEDMAGEIPDPVDLNPHDEWQNIDESEAVTSYIWEDMDPT